MSDTISMDKTVELSIMKGGYFLKFRRQFNKRPETIHLKLCESDNRKQFRNESYSSHKRIHTMNLQDSLSGPDNFIDVSVNNTFRKINTYLFEKEYVELVDKITDSLTKEINHLKNPIVDLYYKKADLSNSFTTKSGGEL